MLEYLIATNRGGRWDSQTNPLGREPQHRHRDAALVRSERFSLATTRTHQRPFQDDRLETSAIATLAWRWHPDSFSVGGVEGGVARFGMRVDLSHRSEAFPQPSPIAVPGKRSHGAQALSAFLADRRVVVKKWTSEPNRRRGGFGSYTQLLKGLRRSAWINVAAERTQSPASFRGTCVERESRPECLSGSPCDVA